MSYVTKIVKFVVASYAIYVIYLVRPVTKSKKPNYSVSLDYATKCFEKNITLSIAGFNYLSYRAPAARLYSIQLSCIEISFILFSEFL